MGRLILPCRNKKVTIMNDKLQKNLKGTYIRETREMVDRIALYREATEKAKKDNDFNLAKYFIVHILPF